MKKTLVFTCTIVILLMFMCGCSANQTELIYKGQDSSSHIWHYNVDSKITVDVSEIGLSEQIVLGFDQGHLTQKNAQEAVWILGDKEPMRDVYLVVENQDNVLLQSLGFARSETYLKVCDMDGDGLDEIFVHMNMNESGDGMRPTTQIWKVGNGELLCIFNINEEGIFNNLSFDTGFEAELLDGYKIKVSNHFDKLNKTVDVSEEVHEEYWVEKGLYDTQGKVIDNNDLLDLTIMEFHSCVVDDFDDDGIYEFKGAQEIWFDYNVVYLGTGLSTIKYDTEIHAFKVVEADFTEESDYSY